MMTHITNDTQETCPIYIYICYTLYTYIILLFCGVINLENDSYKSLNMG